MKKYLLFMIFFLSLITLSYGQTSFFKPITNTSFNTDHIIAIPITANPNINGTTLAVGDEIGIFNTAGRCFGAVVWNKVATDIVAKKTTVTDPNAPQDGFNPNEVMLFRVYSKSLKKAYYATVKYDAMAPNRDVYVVKGLSALTSLTGYLMVSVDNKNNDLPLKYTLTQNFPNPFNPSTQITFSVPEDSKVSVIIYDINGREITRIVNQETRTAGTHQIEWNGMDSKGNKVSSGVYFYKMEAFTLDAGSGKNIFNQVRSMLLTK